MADVSRHGRCARTCCNSFRTVSLMSLRHLCAGMIVPCLVASSGFAATSIMTVDLYEPRSFWKQGMAPFESRSGDNRFLIPEVCTFFMSSVRLTTMLCSRRDFSFYAKVEELKALPCMAGARTLVQTTSQQLAFAEIFQVEIKMCTDGVYEILIYCFCISAVL